MTNVTTPIEAMFEMQRQSIKQSQQLFQQGLELQQNAAQTFLRNSISAQRSAQKQGTQLSKELFNAQFDAVESALGDDEFRASINSQFSDFEITQDQAWDNFESEFINAFDDLSDQQKQLVAQSVNSVLSAQEDAEQNTIQSVQEAEDVAETIQQQTEQRSQTAQKQTEEGTQAIEDVSEEPHETASESATNR